MVILLRRLYLSYGKKLENSSKRTLVQELTVHGKASETEPYFDRKTGSVTVGNACPITDGGSAMLLASREALEEHNLVPLAKLKRVDFAGLEPERMGMGPLVAIDKVLKKTGMKFQTLTL